MSSRLLTPAELGETLGVTEAEAETLRQRHHWSHVRLTRFKVRYTPEQVDAIVAKHTVTPATPAAGSAPAKLPGQSAKSAARGRTT